ncbi:hypothetical protein DW228_06290 [Bacteroides fragilis]|uniref:Uncharacterized protein n=1 Tax=Bacteroides fragilis TaxID=817 RepID=A0A396C9U2_BACFG|nr:hypothetical protein [Bacteroides fragilis]RHH14406.1 hypothetical protein DW228_06290 [Bacteroides fragilis]
MKTRRFCPKCGRPVLKSPTKGYVFQCFCCDEDFYRFEVLRKKDMADVRFIRKQAVLHERQQEYVPHSLKKPYPRYRFKTKKTN